MIGLVFLGIVVLAILAAMTYDIRARRRGSRIASSNDMKNEAIQSRVDVVSFHSPSIQGGSMDWATYRHRDRKSSTWRRRR